MGGIPAIVEVAGVPVEILQGHPVWELLALREVGDALAVFPGGIPQAASKNPCLAAVRDAGAHQQPQRGRFAGPCCVRSAHRPHPVSTWR